MGKKKKNRKRGSAPECLHIVRYTPEAWMKCYPGSDLEEYEEEQTPYCNSDCFLNCYSAAEDEFGPDGMDGVREIRNVVIDDEFFAWLEKEGRKNTPEERLAYDLPDEKAEELFKKHKFDRDYHLMALPVLILQDPGEKEYELSPGTTLAIQTCLGHVFGGKNIWFPGFVMKGETLTGNIRRLFAIGAAYFEEGARVTVGTFRSIKSSNDFDIQMPVTAFLPFMTKGSFDRFRTTPEEFCTYKRNDIPDDHTFDFLGAGVEDMLEKDFRDTVVMAASCIHADAADIACPLYGMDEWPEDDPEY